MPIGKNSGYKKPNSARGYNRIMWLLDRGIRLNSKPVRLRSLKDPVNAIKGVHDRNKLNRQFDRDINNRLWWNRLIRFFKGIFIRGKQ